MKTRTIRVRSFIWLVIHTAVVFLLILLTLAGYDFYEYLEDPANAGDEIEEILIMLGSMALLFPISLIGAWYISRRLLRPWRSLVAQADRIRGGSLDERIEVENPADEIGRLAATLNKTFDAHQNLLDRLQRFSYDASHQLRNPLAAIRTSGEVCLMQPRTKEAYISTIEGILKDTVRLSRTVNQLLLLARAASGALDEYRTEVSMLEIAEGVVREGRAGAEKRDLSIRLAAPENPVVVFGVPDLLREALSNLLDNAIKFSPENTTIELRLTQSRPHTVRVEVCDEGPGLDPEHKATVFRPFHRGDAPAQKEGSGLGLGIVADICRAHHATFGIEDNPGAGSIFWLEFPDQ